MEAIDETAAILALEDRRCRALGKRDAAVLREILADDYVHVHAHGLIDDRDAHIEGIILRPRQASRGRVQVRRFGETAVLVGVLVNQMGDQIMTAIMTQVAVKSDGRWRFVSGHVTRKAVD